MDNIAAWKKLLRENDDLLLQIYTAADIDHARKEGKTGILLGFQNVSAFEDQIGYIALFRELGVRIVQIAYNTQNLVGSGCYESNDSGLSDFGREVIAEMNRLGIICDLSHVGARTAREVIVESRKPVCFSHCLPSALKEHPRNKTDEELRFLADHGGFVGVTMFPPFLKRGTSATIEDYLEAIDHVANVVGEDRVGIGTDFTQGHDKSFFEWVSHDKGNARRLTALGEIINPAGLRTIAEFPNLTAAMQRACWPEPKIRRVMGENWVSFLREAWGE
jgi:membrane dipeptidase